MKADVFLSYSKVDIQWMAKRIIKRVMTNKELRLLKRKMIVSMNNLMIKIKDNGDMK